MGNTFYKTIINSILLLFFGSSIYAQSQAFVYVDLSGDLNTGMIEASVDSIYQEYDKAWFYLSLNGEHEMYNSQDKSAQELIEKFKNYQLRSPLVDQDLFAMTREFQSINFSGEPDIIFISNHKNLFSLNSNFIQHLVGNFLLANGIIKEDILSEVTKVIILVSAINMNVEQLEVNFKQYPNYDFKAYY